MPPFDAGLAELPAEEDGLALTLVEEVDQSDAWIAKRNAPLLELPQVTLERFRQGRQTAARQAATILGCLLAHRGDRLVLGQLLLRLPDALQDRKSVV